MNITISQEGTNPITIDTENIRSEEEYTPGKIYNAARVAATAIKHAAPSYLKKLTEYGTNTSMQAIKANAAAANGGLLKRLVNQGAREGYNRAVAQGAEELAKANYKVFFDSAARDAMKKTLGAKVIDSTGRTVLQEATTGQVLGAAALNIASKPLPFFFLTSILGPSLAATVYNTIASVGTFKSGEDFFHSKQFMDKLATKIKSKYDRYPTLKEVENSSKAKNKSGFLAWILGGGQAAGDTVKSQKGSTKFLMKKVDGVPVALTQLMPVLGTMDMKQILGKRVIIATAFVLDQGGNIKSVPLCRGYLKKGLLNKNEVNRGAHDNKTIESSNCLMGYFSAESSCPIFTDDVNEFTSFDEDDDEEGYITFDDDDDEEIVL